MNQAKVERLVSELLNELGEDSSREGLRSTPRRVASMYKFLTKGYDEEVKNILNNAVFKEKYNEMVIVRDIDFFSLCEHHLIPFFGKIHVAYVPNGRIIGLSKIPRIVDCFARRLQVQERLTQQVADTLFQVLKPQGVAVIAEARHLCMIMRGVEKQNSVATTSAMLGIFQSDPKTRSEFLTLVEPLPRT